MPGPRSILRASKRLLHCAAVLTFAAVEFKWRRHDRSVTARAAWMQRSSRRVLQALAIRTDDGLRLPAGPPGLLVCNHLSYLDILVLGSHHPLVFISKQEVQGWPAFGFLVTCAGTIFLRREDRSDVARIPSAMRATIDAGVPVAFFPEGTTSDGAQVGPFHPGLFEPAVQAGWAVTPAWIGYEVGEGSVADEVCYWRDMTFLPHFLNLLTKPWVRATVRTGRTLEPAPNRKVLAASARQAVCELGKTDCKDSPNEPTVVQAV